MYEELWSNHRDSCNEWEGWGFATCLRKVGNAERALEICRNMFKIRPNFEAGKNLYAWCIYDTEIKKDNEEIDKDDGKFFKAVNAILELTSQDQYSPYVKTVFRVIEYIFRTSSSYPANDIIFWVDKLDPDSLSKEPFSFVGKDQKHREIQSDQEKWFAIKTKALEKNRAYEECIELCEKALNNIPKFHYNNNIWFKRRIALSKAHLGNKRQAAEELEVLLQDKKEWFIQHELARIYDDLGEIEKALTYAIEAALNFGKDENKWELFVLMARILKRQGKLEKARNHLAFAVKLREEHGWKIPDSLGKMVTEFNIDSHGTIDKKALFKELKMFWEAEKYYSLPFMNGFVKIILKKWESWLYIR